MKQAPMRTVARRHHGSRRWLFLSWVVLTCLVAARVVAARAWRSAVLTQHVRSFQAEATGVASTLGTSLQRMDDLVASTQAYLLQRPDATNAQLGAWTDSMMPDTRYPG